jgi:hypothetical protein
VSRRLFNILVTAGAKMWRHRWSPRLVGLTLLVVLVGFAGVLTQVAGLAFQDDPRTELRHETDEAEQRWRASGITSYRIVVERVNATRHDQWDTIVVRDGQVTEHTAHCLQARPEPEPCRVQAIDPAEYTVPGLFATARKLLAQNPPEVVDLLFDDTLGHPRRMVRNIPRASDAFQFWRVESFTPL